HSPGTSTGRASGTLFSPPLTTNDQPPTTNYPPMRSDIIKLGDARAPHRSLLRATGLGDSDFNKPFIAVCNSYTDIIPGHVHLDKVGELVKQCIREAG